MLLRRRFTHCAMAIPLILLHLPYSSTYIPLQGVNLTFEGDDSLLRLLLTVQLKCNIALACIIASNRRMHSVV